MLSNLLMAEGGSNTWVMLLVVGGLMIIMMAVSIIPQKKKRKQAQEMMSKISKGDKIKTIGGFVGTVSAIDDATNTLILNLGTEDAPVVVTIDKAAVYTVINPIAPVVVENPEGDKVVVVDEVKSLDDAEDDAKRAKRAEEKAKNKSGKNKKDDLTPVDVFDETSNVIDVEVEDAKKN